MQTLALPGCCRSSCTGSAADKSTTRRATITCSTASNAAPAFVCPSNIPLVQYYRQEKAEIKAIDLEAARTAEAKARYEAKLARLEREKLAREERHKRPPSN